MLVPFFCFRGFTTEKWLSRNLVTYGLTSDTHTHTHTDKSMKIKQNTSDESGCSIFEFRWRKFLFCCLFQLRFEQSHSFDSTLDRFQTVPIIFHENKQSVLVLIGSTSLNISVLICMQECEEEECDPLSYILFYSLTHTLSLSHWVNHSYWTTHSHQIKQSHSQ